MCPSNPFAALHGVLGGQADRLVEVTAVAREEARRRKTWLARVAGWHAMCDAIETRATDSGEQFSDWGEYRGAELGTEMRARLASDLLVLEGDAEAEPEVREVCARMRWLWRGRIQWATLRNVANRKSETQRLDDARLSRADVSAGATGRNKEERAAIRRVNKTKLRAAETARVL